MVPELILAQAQRKVKRRVAHAHMGTGTIPKAQARRSGRAYRRRLFRFNVRMTRRALRGLPMPDPYQRQVGRFAARFPFPASVKAAHFAMRRMEYARRRRYTARPIPRPRTPALPRPRPSAPTASASPAEAPPDGDGGDGEVDGADGDPSPLRPRPTKAKGKRGRPRKRRTFRAYPNGRTYGRRIKALDAVAQALRGRSDAVFATLVPTAPPTESDRRLARVSAHILDDLKRLARALRYRGTTYALVLGTRAGTGAFFPHVHVLIAGAPDLERLAVRYNFHLAHAAPLRNATAAAHYVAAAHQSRHWDTIQGGHGFYTHIAQTEPAAEAPAPVVSLGNSPAQVLQDLAANPPPGPVALGPGVVVIDTARFLAALLQDLDGPPVLRRAALSNARAFLAALGAAGPPVPPTSPPTAKGVARGGR